MQLLHTRDLEEAARALAADHERVVIRNKNILWTPIRLARARIADLHPYIVLNPQAFDGELAAWNAHGGVLVYERAYTRAENIAAHQAQLVVECPMSIADLEAYVDGTRDLAVVYRPPKWDEHRRCAGLLWPSSEICRRYYELVVRAPTDAALGELLELPAGFTVSVDEGMCTELGLTVPQLWRVRNATFRMRDYRMVNAVTLRIAPGDATLAAVYQYIANTFPVFEGKHLIVGSALAKAARHWRVALKELARCGAIERLPTLFCHLPDVMPPHWFKVDAEHQRAKERLAEVIAQVEASPEFTPIAPDPRLRSPAGRSRPKSSASA